MTMTPKKPTPAPTAARRAAAPAVAAAPSKVAEPLPSADMNWYESSYELMRGMDVIECEWPDLPGPDRPAR